MVGKVDGVSNTETSIVAGKASPSYPHPILTYMAGGNLGSGDIVTLVVVTVGAVFVLLAIFLPRMLKTRGADGEPAGAPVSTAGHDRERAAMERVEQAVIQLEETSRELFGRLDTRARVLIHLIEEAEVRTRRIEELQARAKGAGQ